MTLKPHESIVDKWEKAVIAGIKNQNAKMQSNEQKNNTADNSDVKNQARSNKDVVTNAILLETSVSQKSSANKKGSTQFMHYMYSLVEYNGNPFLAKITVEEYGNKTRHRAYNFDRIKCQHYHELNTLR